MELRGSPIEKLYNEQIQARIHKIRGIDERVDEETKGVMHTFHDDVEK